MALDGIKVTMLSEEQLAANLVEAMGDDSSLIRLMTDSFLAAAPPITMLPDKRCWCHDVNPQSVSVRTLDAIAYWCVAI